MGKYSLIISLAYFCLIPSALLIADSDVNNYTFHTSKDFIDIMENSSITYSVCVGKQNTHTDITVMCKEPYTINPYSKIEYDTNGNMTLIMDEPKGEIKEIHKLAAEKLKQKKYEELVNLYQKALELDKNYFMTWVNLGDTYYQQGKYKKAEECLLKAINLNDISYQAYYFLADTYDKMNNNHKALEYITYAYMLNKNNPNIMNSLLKILAKNKMKLNTKRLEFPFEIKKVNDTKCEITFQDGNSVHWMPMANCIACWQMEPQFQSLLRDDKLYINMKMTMYKESIINQISIIKSKMEGKMPVTDKELQINNIFDDKYLNAVLYWEIMAGDAPGAILLIPKEDKAIIIEGYL